MARVSGVSRRRFLGLLGSAGAFAVAPAALRGMAESAPAGVKKCAFEWRADTLYGPGAAVVPEVGDMSFEVDLPNCTLYSLPYWVVPAHSGIYAGLERKK